MWITAWFSRIKRDIDKVVGCRITAAVVGLSYHGSRNESNNKNISKMKNTLKLMSVALLACVMLACGGNEKKITQEDLKAAESTLSDERGMLNKEAVPAVVEQYCEFVKQNPKDPQAPEWLFKAMQVEVRVGETDKAIELTNKLAKDYPEYENVPVALVMLASDVYNDQLHDLDQARATYERVVKDYPDSEWAKTAAQLIEFLGMTPEEMLSKIRPQSEEAETEE